MANNFITDNEIDRILGKITEYRKEPEKRSDHRIGVEEKARLKEEYSRKKAQDFASNFKPSDTFNPSNTFSSSEDLNSSTGTFSSTLAVQSTCVSPNFTNTLPSACLV